MSDYRVLARKYRPQNFDDLIGQEVLVRTLTNAIARKRLAHAFLLTGIRGIGKTTTARIIARALNCLGPAGDADGPTASPCGVCANCTAIAEDRHVDVLEMDAASRTGVDDIREIIETVQYAPTAARYKVYIIDEVHMLSKNAFNALLKTLEEPPPHVKFIFATTELRKIPVTILSRCQRFDLRRVEQAHLAAHLLQVCGKENVEAEDEGLQLIANAAEGSVRDALSILDQAIVHTDSHITSVAVRDMLGLTDRSKNFDLLEHLFAGDIAAALSDFRDLYAAGADPVLLVQTLLEMVHFVTVSKLARGAEEESVTYAEAERARAGVLAESLSVTSLSLVWQMLLKALGEIRLASNPMLAAEMAFVRIAHAGELPPPAELLRSLKPSGSKAPAGASGAPSSLFAASGAEGTATSSPVSGAGGAGTAQAVSAPVPHLQPQIEETPMASVRSFEDAVQLFKENREILLYTHLMQEARLVSFRQGHIELNLEEQVPAEVAGKVAKALSDWTGSRWLVSLSKQAGQETLAVAFEQKAQMIRQKAAENPLVARVLEMFPGAEVTNVINEGENKE